MKKIVRLTESDLHKIIKESVKRILREGKYDTPNGGIDSYAFDYDDAIENAESLDDWDKRMALRSGYMDARGYAAQQHHPQRDNYTPGSTGAHMYANPSMYNINDDDVLNNLERTADFGRKESGFPF